MAINKKLTVALVEIAHRLLDDADFSRVESLANFLQTSESGRWKQLPDDEKLFWIGKLADLLGPSHGLLVMSEYADWGVLSEAFEMAFYYREKLSR